jgi:Arc/MetJ-type ribon-helix-helix transcriptional regulator
MMPKIRDDNKSFRLPDNLAYEMDKLIGKHGFTSRAEIAKQAIREYLDKHYTTYKELKPPPLEHFNMDSNGAKILDRQLREVVQVLITPKGITCEHCKTDECIHINFALTCPDIIEVIEKRRKEGWKLHTLP